jgi:hypothetical protein
MADVKPRLRLELTDQKFTVIRAPLYIVDAILEHHGNLRMEDWRSRGASRTNDMHMNQLSSLFFYAILRNYARRFEIRPRMTTLVYT